MKHTRLLAQMQAVITFNLLLWLAMLFPALRGGTREERAIAICGRGVCGDCRALVVLRRS